MLGQLHPSDNENEVELVQKVRAGFDWNQNMMPSDIEGYVSQESTA